MPVHRGKRIMELNVRAETKKVERYLNRIQRRQLPFAIARALTWTVQDAQKSIIAAIPHIFRVTKKWWLKTQPTGIKIRPATKIHLTATVYTNAPFADLQESGGTKRPRGRMIAVPTAKTPKSRRKAGGAAVMMKQKKTFATKTGIYRRKGGKKNQTIEKVFTFTKKARVRPRFGFKDIARKVAVRRFPNHFYKSLTQALRTAR